MSNLDLARWQFAITTVYHFLFVPITIGMSAVVAGYHTAWVRTRNPEYLRLAKWLGKLFTINFALGLVTGIVQEFQFGMNWSDYSRFVGDIFGAPLAFEALLAFFMESTFLGLWIFGWGRIPEKLHAWTMWITHLGTVLSAFFILAANSFMQNPVGYQFNPQTGRAEMADFVAVLTNKVQLVTFPHVLLSSYMTGGAVVLAVALWHWLRRGPIADRDRQMYRKAVQVGAVMSLVASFGVVITGDLQGKVMTEVQPMKMAAAEGLYRTEKHASFSILSIGSLDGSDATRVIEVPGLLSFLGHGSFDAEVKGIRDVQADYQARYADTPRTADKATDYVPNIPTTYWTFRLMMGVGFLSMLCSLLALVATRKGRTPPTAPWWKHVVIWSPLLPVLAISFGWIFTEVGRQPWIVFGQMTTASGVSPSVPAWSVLVSMVVYTALYAALAVVEVKLFLKYTRVGAEPVDPQSPAEAGEDRPLVFAY
ncbi:cytochrome ubiquinol oxidase subunit I [Arsenicicoccus dermatophilus]|uniref:cytochrome ubiquinol oxidase subunit I n=1 Tax=Arsenicicoccus dermatophilus TaxID=1076331 RepID=UPI0039171C88